MTIFFAQDRFRLIEQHLAIIQSPFRSIILREHENIIFRHIGIVIVNIHPVKTRQYFEIRIADSGQGMADSERMIPFFSHRNERHRRHNMSMAD